MKIQYVEQDITLTFQERKGLKEALEKIVTKYEKKDFKPPAYVESILRKLKALSNP